MGSMTTGPAASRTAGPRILVVDDEPEVGGLVERVLAADGYVVGRASDGKDGLRQALDGSWGLVILDLIMPEMSGSEVLTRLRRDRPDQPVMILSCVSDVRTKVRCLDLGAQDYLTKPFQLAELLARVRVRLRDDHARDDGHLADDGHLKGNGHQDGQQKDEVVQVGGLTLDVGRLRADAGSGPVPLTRLEFLFLRILMDHAGQAVPKDQLLASVWGLDFDPGSNVVDVCVRRLRSKLGFDLIKTVRGSGYQLAC
jgi:DNA-binding response OmpR family regulator